MSGNDKQKHFECLETFRSTPWHKKMMKTARDKNPDKYTSKSHQLRSYIAKGLVLDGMEIGIGAGFELDDGTLIK